jgi:hypothetical protein
VAGAGSQPTFVVGAHVQTWAANRTVGRERKGPRVMGAVSGCGADLPPAQCPAATVAGHLPVHRPNVHSRRRCASFSVIATHRQEVRPMNAVSALGAPPQSTIARLS